MLSVYENVDTIFIIEEHFSRTTRKELFEKFSVCKSNGGKSIYLVNRLGDCKQLLYVGCHFAGMWCREKEDLLKAFKTAYDEKGNKDFFLEFDVWEDILEETKDKLDKAFGVII